MLTLEIAVKEIMYNANSCMLLSQNTHCCMRATVLATSVLRLSGPHTVHWHVSLTKSLTSPSLSVCPRILSGLRGINAAAVGLVYASVY